MLRTVLDPGVLIAAIITPRGICGQILQAALDGRFALIVCPSLLAELADVLPRAKFRRWVSLNEASRFVQLVERLAETQPDPAVVMPVTPDRDDDYLVALALASGADYLVSGDPHLTNLTVQQPRILTPSRFLPLVGATS
jgi:uncharacterized protein